MEEKTSASGAARIRELAVSLGKIIEFVLGKYGKGLVPLALAESYLEKGQDDYEVMALIQKGRMQAESGGKSNRYSWRTDSFAGCI